MKGFPESDGTEKLNLDLSWTDKNGNLVVPIVDEAQSAFLRWVYDTTISDHQMCRLRSTRSLGVRTSSQS